MPVERRWLLGFAPLLLLPLLVTLLAFRTLATSDADVWALQTPIATVDADALYQQALADFERGDYPAAEQQMRQLIDQGVASAEIFHNLAGALAAQGKAADAIDSYERALSADPQFIASHVGIAQLFHESGRLAQAEAHYEGALSVDDGYAPAWHGLGLLYQKIGRTELAIDAQQQALRAEPQHAAALVALATLYANRRDFERALPLLQQAVRLEPDHSAARYTLAVVYTHQNNWPAARRQWQLIVDRDPGSDWALQAQAQLNDR